MIWEDMGEGRKFSSAKFFFISNSGLHYKIILFLLTNFRSCAGRQPWSPLKPRPEAMAPGFQYLKPTQRYGGAVARPQLVVIVEELRTLYSIVGLQIWASYE